MARLPPTPAVGELAAAMGLPAPELALVLDSMDRVGIVERWTDPGRPGSVRVMMSARTLARLGLKLAPRGDRWNPDRPPPSSRGEPGGSPRPVDHGEAGAIIAGAIGPRP